MKRPAFQFYPADWRKDPALSICSLAARGLWIEMMCIAHESEEYGVLVVAGKPMTAQHIARSVGESVSVVNRLLAELEEAGVFSRDDRGCIFSRRMRRDEHIRDVRAAAGRLGGNPNLLKQEDKHLVKQTDKQSPTPSSSSSNTEKTLTPQPPVPGGVVVPVRPRRKSEAMTFKAFFDRARERGEKAITDYTPVWQFAENAAIPREFIELCWLVFRNRYGPGGAREAKRYSDWRKTFRNAVEDNWFKLWSFDAQGQCFLTAQGRQHENTLRGAA